MSEPNNTTQDLAWYQKQIDIFNANVESNVLESMVLRAKSLTNVDIVNDYTWTLSPMTEALKNKTPVIYLQEYQMTKSMLTNAFSYYSSNVKAVGGGLLNSVDVTSHFSKHSNKDVAYEGMFDYSAPTNYNYWFPYYTEDNFSVNNTWAASDAIEKVKSAAQSGKFGEGVKILGDGVDMVAGAAIFAEGIKYPKTGFLDKPMIWQNTGNKTFTINFYLFNTIKSSDILRNWEFCNQIVYQNLYAKITFISAYPPVFYMVNIPGQYSSIGSYISDLKIQNRGNIRRMILDNGMEANIPDAYEISITLTDMVMPSRNLLNRVFKENNKITTQTQSTQLPSSPLRQPQAPVGIAKSFSQPSISDSITNPYIGGR